VQWQVEDHVTKMTHMIKRVLQKHQRDQLLNIKGNQSGAAVMRLSQMESEIMGLV